MNRDPLPFTARFSLAPLIDFWRGRDDAGHEPVRRAVEAELATHPELYEQIQDLSLVRTHRPFVDLLMSAVFPAAASDSELLAALMPFESRIVYATPRFYRLFSEENSGEGHRVRLDVETFMLNKILAGYLHILRTVYGEEINFDYPTIVTSPDPTTGLERYFKMTVDLRFMEIKRVQAPVHLSEEDRKHLLANLSDLSVWTRLIPPDAFAFQGFTMLKAVDVTDEQVISGLRRDMLECKNAADGASYEAIRNHLRTFLQEPEIDHAIASVGGAEVVRLRRMSASKDEVLFEYDLPLPIAALRETIFERSESHRTTQVIEDLATHQGRTEHEEQLLARGLRSLLVAPLFFRARFIGMLYLWSRKPFVLNELNAIKLGEVLPLFSTVVQRVQNDLSARVQGVILGQYTAIHPSVQWRFRQAAMNYVTEQDAGRPAEPESIVFEDVYPLYAATDIRGSSGHRAQAVQSDLLDQIGKLDEIFRRAREIKPLPIIDHLLIRSEQFKETIRTGLTSGDEAGFRDFHQRDVDPLLDHVRSYSRSIDEQVRAYIEATNSASGALHNRRRAFDESISLINRTISSYLDREEARAQEMFPHYFEKHQTDGIEFTVYLGESLNEDGSFDPIYLRNMRLWQLMVMCEITRRLEAVKPRLKVPLETTHLILAQRAPLTIRFRFDERRFDVDGAYNILFEIMKRRVDKALLKDNPERLTQPGRIAIVYSQSREAREYEEYIESLQASGYLKNEVEEVELDDLPGMRGLRALRVCVAGGRPRRSADIASEILKRAVLN